MRGSFEFPFNTIRALFLQVFISQSYPLKKYGLLSGHRQGVAIQGHMPISYVEQLRSLPVRAVQQMPEVAYKSEAAVSDFIGAWGAVSHQQVNGLVYTGALLATTAGVQKQGLNAASIGAILCS